MATVVGQFPAHTRHLQVVDRPRGVESAVVDRLEELDGCDPVLAAMARALAQTIDEALLMERAGALLAVARTSAELRQLMRELDPAQQAPESGWLELVQELTAE